MTRGNQRDKDRARAQARAAKNAKGTKGAPKIGGANADADALAAKIAKKKADKEAGTLKKKERDLGDKYVKKKKAPTAINPHTGKKCAKTGAKLAKQLEAQLNF